MTVDLANLVLAGSHIIRAGQIESQAIKLAIFISAPEILFTFPLFAISLDFLELCIILAQDEQLTAESYLRTNKNLKVLFLGVSFVIILIFILDMSFTIDLVETKPHVHELIKAFGHSVDSILNILAAIFSVMLLILFVGEYLSLKKSMKALREAIVNS